MDEKKQKAIDIAIAQLDKRFGKGSVRSLSDQKTIAVDTISTGVLSLDYATGIGGFPRRRITEIYGLESIGKSTLAYCGMAETQRAGGIAAIVDAEHSVDLDYMSALGINPSDLLVSQPDTGEDGLEIVSGLVRSGAVDMIVVDSVAALVPKAEVDGDMGDSHMGLQARMMSQGLRKLAHDVANANCAVIFINQLREKIGVMFGNPFVTPGGRALKYWASLRIEVRGSRTKDVPTAFKDKALMQTFIVQKNKLARPWGKGEGLLVLGQGYDRFWMLTELGIKLGIMEKSGAWVTFGDTNMQRQSCSEEALDAIEEVVRDIMNQKEVVLVPEDDSGEIEDDPLLEKE